jgi:hypothetical protein
MSDNSNVLIIGAAVLGYLYIKGNQQRVVAAQQQTTAGGVKSLPATVGSGWQQVGVGAVAGFLQGVIGGVRNNTSQTVFPSPYDPMDQVRGGQVQEAVPDFSEYGIGDDYGGWA